MKFHGRILRTCQTPAFRVTETIFGGNATLRDHRHEGAYFSFLLAGGYVEKTRTGECVCLRGTVIWHPAGETHSDRFLALGGHLMNLELKSAWIASAEDKIKLPSGRRVVSDGPAYALGLEFYHAVNNDSQPEEDCGIELLALFSKCSATQQPAWLRRALELVHASFDRQVTLAIVAKEVGVHPVHVARSFPRYVGCTLGDYLARIRLRHAFDLLQTRETTIASVAAECGFSDQAHLCRVFKKNTGLTPSGYRKLLLGSGMKQ